MSGKAGGLKMYQQRLQGDKGKCLGSEMVGGKGMCWRKA